jgi:hypothetical protein
MENTMGKEFSSIRMGINMKDNFWKEKKHGKGIYNWADGDYYDGDWFKDSAHGYGASMMGTDFYDGQFQ